METIRNKKPLTMRHAPCAKPRRGFTLIELLIVMAILGILVTLGIGNFATARLKARDAQRKSDLATIAKSLEAYANDHARYPLSDAGAIDCTTPSTCAWGGPFADNNGTLYAATLPDDASADRSYAYVTTDGGTSYTLYAALENDNDPAYDNTLSQDCGGTTCNYQIKSSNLN